MKNLRLLIPLLFIGFSCVQEELEPSQGTTNLKNVASTPDPVNCTINGVSSVCPNSQATYSYSTPDFVAANVNWRVTAGDISILNGQGSTSARLAFGSNFNGGTFEALGSGGDNSCGYVTFNVASSAASCRNLPLSITTNIPAAYPARHPFGRYRLTGYPQGANINWSVNDARIMLISGDHIHVAANSRHPFSITATVTWSEDNPCSSTGISCSQRVYRSYVPEEAM